jgi:hypothetical protein
MDRNLLNAEQMANFVSDGYLRFDALVPDELNRAVMAEIASDSAQVWFNNERKPMAEFLTMYPAYARIIALPSVRGIIHSLIGPDPHADHFAEHKVAPGGRAWWWHADATIDGRTDAFDIQLFYFPHDTPPEAGGTIILPGSHFRFVHESTIARYQNIAGQLRIACPAGTMVVAHQNLWHASQPNSTDKTRAMLKLRLNPSVRQQGLFDMRDIGATGVLQALTRNHPWHGAEHRIEILQRLRLWRAITGTDYDADLWLTRLENKPTAMARPNMTAARLYLTAPTGIG